MFLHRHCVVFFLFLISVLWRKSRSKCQPRWSIDPQREEILILDWGACSWRVVDSEKKNTVLEKMISGIGTETRCWNGEGFRGEAAGVIPIPFNTTDLSSYPIMHFELRLSINLGISFLFESGFHTLFCDASYSSSDLKIL